MKKKHSLHHIDASVFLELFIKPSKRESYQRECEAYLKYKIGKYFRGRLSLLSFGEIAKVIASIDNDDSWETQNIFSGITRIINDKDIDFHSPRYDSIRLSLNIIDRFRLEPADALHIASASEDDECNMFITLDQKILNNQLEIEKCFGLKIKHPSAL